MPNQVFKLAARAAAAARPAAVTVTVTVTSITVSLRVRLTVMVLALDSKLEITLDDFFQVLCNSKERHWKAASAQVCRGKLSQEQTSGEIRVGPGRAASESRFQSYRDSESHDSRSR